MADNQTFKLLPVDENTPTVVDSMVIKQDIYPDTGIITKRNFNQYGLVESIQIQNETHTVFKNRIILNQLPSTYYRVSIAGLQENITNDTLTANQFRVVYESGIVYFPTSFEGKEITITEYYGIGTEMIPTSRIYIGTDSDGNITNTLYDMIKVGTNAIVALEEVGGVLADGKATAERLETDTKNATATDTKLVQDTNYAKEVDSTLVKDTQTGNQTIADLEKQIGVGTPLLNNLETQNQNATSNIATLEKDIANGKIVNENLYENISIGKPLLSSLESNISTAQGLNLDVSKNNQIVEEVGTLGKNSVANQLAIGSNTQNIQALQEQIIGGSNLLSNANNFWATGLVLNASNPNIVQSNMQLEAGNYTLTVASLMTNSSNGEGVQGVIYNNDWTFCTKTVLATSSEMTVSSIDIDIKTAGEFNFEVGLMTPQGHNITSTSQSTGAVYWCILQTGTKATQWQSNQLEIINQLATIEQNNNQTNGKLQTLGSTLAENSLSISNIQTNISSQESKLNALGSQVTNNVNDISQATSIAKANAKVNLLMNSNFSGNSTCNGAEAGIYGFANTCTAMPIEAGKTYTLTASGSVDQSILDKNGDLKVCLYDINWSANSCTLNINSVNPTVVSQTFTATKTEVMYISSYLNPKTLATGTNGNVHIDWYCLVEGSSPVDKWYECPYDLTNGINLFGGSNFFPTGKTTTLNGDLWNVTEVELQEGVTYCFTAQATAMANNMNSGALCMIFDSSWSQSVSLFFEQSGSPSIQSCLLIPNKTEKFTFGFYSRDAQGHGHNVSCTIDWYTLSQGTKPRAWSPSMGDIKGSNINELQLLGRSTSELFIDNAKINKQNQFLGKNMSNLMLKTGELNSQNQVLGRNTANLMIENSSLTEKSNMLGKSTAQLMLSNSELQTQNKNLEAKVNTLVKQNEELQNQVKVLAQTVISSKLQDSK